MTFIPSAIFHISIKILNKFYCQTSWQGMCNGCVCVSVDVSYIWNEPTNGKMAEPLCVQHFITSKCILHLFETELKPTTALNSLLDKSIQSSLRFRCFISSFIAIRDAAFWNRIVINNNVLMRFLLPPQSLNGLLFAQHSKCLYLYSIIVQPHSFPFENIFPKIRR